jgi:hypothetical protein
MLVRQVSASSNCSTVSFLNRSDRHKAALSSFSTKANAKTGLGEDCASSGATSFTARLSAENTISCRNGRSSWPVLGFLTVVVLSVVRQNLCHCCGSATSACELLLNASWESLYVSLYRTGNKTTFPTISLSSRIATLSGRSVCQRAQFQWELP